MAQNNRKSVLIIDDDVHLLEVISLVLGEEFLTSRAENGEDGLRIAREERPDLVILDMMLPKLSGESVLEKLREAERTRRIPVIILTAFNFSDEDAARLEKEPNVRALLRKPFGSENLRRRIHAVLGSDRA